MLGVRRMFEALLQMNERAGRLDQSLEEVRVGRFGVEPKLFQDIVRLIVPLFVPATKKGTVIRMIGNRVTGSCFAAAQSLHELGNSLAFAHGVRNLVAPAMMGKRARFSLREGERLHDRRRSEK